MNVKVYKAISDPTRRRIMQLLRERDMTAGELAEKFDFAKQPCHVTSLSCAKQI